MFSLLNVIHFFILLCFLTTADFYQVLPQETCTADCNIFPDYFKFGAGTSAFQIEGAWNEDGKGPSIFDTLFREHPELVADNSTADVGPDSYHLYHEDVKRLKELGVNYYRFSISWTRILPTGDLASLNPAGIIYYNNLINFLCEERIEPMVTMVHFDLPQYLQELGGLMNPIFVNYFREYARVLFENFGDRVKHWITFNEPGRFCSCYGEQKSIPIANVSGVGVYLCGYYTQLAHAEVYHLYKKNYAGIYGGKIGMALNSYWYYQKKPGNDIVKQALAFDLGFMANPIFGKTGGWPEEMQAIVDYNSQREGRAWSRLPAFTPEQIDFIKGSADFFGLNYYTSMIVDVAQFGNTPSDPPNPSFARDANINFTSDPAWTKKGKSSWLYSVPTGLTDNLLYIRETYNNPEVIIVENGWSDDGELEDEGRVDYIRSHLTALLLALQQGCRVTAYTYWSLIDNFEFTQGYTEVSSMGIDQTCTEGCNIFPQGFKFGVATASYQIEGGWNDDGKGPSIWDTVTHQHPELIKDRSSADVGPDSYHLYREDVKILKELGVHFYRFSISWSRIMPTGEISSLNPAGVKYYNDLINLLLAEEIEPMVTMFHYDLPQYLQDLGGLTNPLIVGYFREYARVLYDKYGDRVKHWITFNEPSESCIQGYGSGTQAPLINLHGVGEYYCAYVVLLAHAEAYHLYKNNYSSVYGGKVGITLDSRWFYQKTPGNELVEQGMAFQLGFFANPIFSSTGGWAKQLQTSVDRNSEKEGRAWSRLPSFNSKEIEFLKGSADFLGLNYYSARFVKEPNFTDFSSGGPPNPSWERDQNLTYYPDPSWKRAKSIWLYMVPQGLKDILMWIRTTYNNPEVIITENGWSDDGEMEDEGRVEYLKQHLKAVLEALQEGCQVTGYTHWSLFDNFEWMMGYTEKFGLYRVDEMDPDKKRIEKTSARIYGQIIKSNKLIV
ncbi:hypothetical protein DMENIID0001_006860 [Sergentomyia squamirostris]